MSRAKIKPEEQSSIIALPPTQRIRFFFARFRRLPKTFWALQATIFGIADFLTWSILSDISPSERLHWTLGIVLLVFVVTIIVVIRTPTTDEKMAQARVLQRTARVAYENTNYKEAKRILEQAIKCDSERVDSWGLLGRTQIRLGNFQDAIPALSKALELTQLNRTLYLHCRGQVYTIIKQYGRALDDFEECLGIEPDRTITLRWRALVWVYLGRLDNALNDIENALRLKPRYICGHATKAIILHRLGQIEKAQNELKRCSSLKPEDSDDFYCLAQSYAQLGNLDQTISLLRSALQLDPKYRARVTIDPFFENLSGDVSFKEVIR